MANRSRKSLGQYEEAPETKKMRKFWGAMIEAVVTRLRKSGINTYEELKRHKARKMLDEPLWKLAELNGKYGGRYFSEGAMRMADKCGRPYANGSWAGRHEKGEKCQLEHAFERHAVISELVPLTGPRAREHALERLVTCVVLKSEHERLHGKNGPAVDSSHDPWARYRARKVGVYDRGRGCWIVPRQGGRH